MCMVVIETHFLGIFTVTVSLLFNLVFFFVNLVF